MPHGDAHAAIFDPGPDTMSQPPDDAWPPERSVGLDARTLDFASTAVVDPITLQSVVLALARMARASRRHEADFDSAMRGSGLALTLGQREDALRQLLECQFIERLIPLRDGGILLCVTGMGLGCGGVGDQPG